MAINQITFTEYLVKTFTGGVNGGIGIFDWITVNGIDWIH